MYNEEAQILLGISAMSLISSIFLSILSLVSIQEEYIYKRSVQYANRRNKVYLEIKIKKYRSIPYLEITPPNPQINILFIQGGPDYPALDSPNNFERYLAYHFHARVIKPAYYGVSERSHWSNTPSINLRSGTTKSTAAKELLTAIDTAYAGMPKAVDEVRMFIRHWDSSKTSIVGESHGATLVALAGNVARKSRIVLIAPVIASRNSIVNASIAGRYHMTNPIEVPQIVVNNHNITSELFETSLAKRTLLKRVSLAYYNPWAKSTLADLLKISKIKSHIIVGLKDRVGMVHLTDYNQFKSSIPQGTVLCTVKNMSHQYPTSNAKAEHCFNDSISSNSNYHKIQARRK